MNLANMTIPEILEFIEHNFDKDDFVHYEQYFNDYFSVSEERKVVPYLLYNFRREPYSDIADFYKLFKKQNNLEDDIYDKKYSFSDFMIAGYSYFLLELWKNNYFEDESNIKAIAYKIIEVDNNDFRDHRFFSQAVVDFIKDKEDYVQEILVDEFLLSFIDNCDWIIEHLMKAYRNGNDYVKYTILDTLMSMRDVAWNFPLDLNIILLSVIDDYQVDNERLRHLIILLIDHLFRIYGENNMKIITENLEADMAMSIRYTERDKEKVRKIVDFINDFKNSPELRYGEFAKKAKRILEEYRTED